jgi:phosphoribosyl 1,2-cyclic phosphate phosphodiesterase
MKNKLSFLGTGGSVGVPVIGCSCAVCHSKEPRNQRLRPSVLLQIQHRQFLIDVGPDFRLQALRSGIKNLDGILLTHAHHDHTGGIDDLRPIYFHRRSPLPILLSAETAHDLQMRYYYLFQTRQEQEHSHPRFHLQILPDQEGSIVFEDLPVQYVTYTQGGMPVNGFRIGNLAYLTDIRHYSPSIFEQLKGIHFLIISALRYTPSLLHFSVDEAIDFAKELRAKEVWLTHISHDLDHHHASSYFPANIFLAYDGLEIEFE